MVQNIQEGLVDVANNMSTLFCAKSSGENYKWFDLPEGILGKGLSMGDGAGDELLDFCNRCEVAAYENGVISGDCEEIECPDEFIGSFSWDPFRPVVAILPAVTCTSIVGEDADKYYCYYNI
ncbi:uncharacterized protein [Ptychodera flava]|uniref:uncharacterized protein n=1 Tax=Ptychodera flava TaxID=63121 RepID=UPI00396A4F6A